MDYCVVSAAIRMRITPPVRQYTAVGNTDYAMVAAGTRYRDGSGANLSAKSQEKLGNIFETLAGLWFVRENIWSLVTVVYRAAMQEPATSRVWARLRRHRAAQKPPRANFRPVPGVGQLREQGRLTGLGAPFAN